MFEGLKSRAESLKKEISIYQLVLKDRRTPRTARLLLWLAVGYLLLPFDIIPDFIPVIGHIDDLVVVPFLIFLAMKMVPEEIFDDCRKQVKEA